MTRLPELFSRNDRALDEVRQHEQTVTILYAEIGRLTTQVNGLRKIWSATCVELSAWRW